MVPDFLDAVPINLVATALYQIARAIMDRPRFYLPPANGLNLVKEGPMTQSRGGWPFCTNVTIYVLRRSHLFT